MDFCVFLSFQLYLANVVMIFLHTYSPSSSLSFPSIDPSIYLSITVRLYTVCTRTRQGGEREWERERERIESFSSFSLSLSLSPIHSRLIFVTVKERKKYTDEKVTHTYIHTIHTRLSSRFHSLLSKKKNRT